MDKQINHDKLHDESKTRTHKLSKLPDEETQQTQMDRVQQMIRNDHIQYNPSLKIK